MLVSMRLSIIAVISLMLTAACGRHDDKKPTEAPAASTSPAATDAAATDAAATKAPDQATLPAFFIARVPVDASGQEQLAQYEGSVVGHDGPALSAATVGDAFQNGAKVEVKDELDQTSSAQQWYRPFSLINQIGRAIFGPSPRFFYATSGYNYYYSPYNVYNNGGYNYYSYGYGGCGGNYGGNYGGYGY